MKKFLSTILTNSILLIYFYVTCFFDPQYQWAAKTLFYIIIPMNIVGSLYFLAHIEKLDKELKDKYDSFLWNAIDAILDIIWIVILTILNFKILLTIYFISILFSIALRKKYFEEKKKPNLQ